MLNERHKLIASLHYAGIGIGEKRDPAVEKALYAAYTLAGRWMTLLY